SHVRLDHTSTSKRTMYFEAHFSKTELPEEPVEYHALLAAHAFRSGVRASEASCRSIIHPDGVGHFGTLTGFLFLLIVRIAWTACLWRRSFPSKLCHFAFD